MSRTYMVKELFESLQGEGVRAGSLSVFVRFTGCNNWTGHPEQRDKGWALCSLWCDTDFRKEGATKMTAREIAEAVTVCWRARRGQPWVVLTGGEPLLQVDAELVEALHENEIRVAVETNGTVRPPPGLDWLTVSPKLDHSGQPLPLEVERADELKVVLPGAPPGAGPHVSGWFEGQLLELAESGEWSHKFVQPQDPIVSTMVERSQLKGGVLAGHEYETNVARCIAWCRHHPDWVLSLQTHKLIGVR